MWVRAPQLELCQSRWDLSVYDEACASPVQAIVTYTTRYAGRAYTPLTCEQPGGAKAAGVYRGKSIFLVRWLGVRKVPPKNWYR